MELEAALEHAKSQWPRLKVSRAAFRAHLAASGPKALPHAGDLYLAFACAANDAAAARELTARVEREVPAAVRHFGQGSAFAEDVSQQLLGKLLAEKKIQTYAGRGPLAAWLRAAAVRTAINAVESQKSQASLDSNIMAPARSNADVDLAVMRKKYGATLKVAVEAALKELQTDDRNVLRFYFVDGLTVEEIARIRGAHKSTVSRLITRIRKELLAQVKGDLTAKMNARPDELSSVLRAVVSQLDVSLERALR
ncbi:MAG: sigma-70 family RNA polymerase sigma factor [Myxococcaceae bacterium]|nr:sigma-70 family RNA polymerase sigma factor [Myxococcaceae bacterium]